MEIERETNGSFVRQAAKTQARFVPTGIVHQAEAQGRGKVKKELCIENGLQESFPSTADKFGLRSGLCDR